MSFDARPFLERKLAGLAAHRSAFGLTEEMVRHPSSEVARMLDAFQSVLEREVFLLGGTRVPTATWPLRDFFEGLQEVA